MLVLNPFPNFLKDKKHDIHGFQCFRFIILDISDAHFVWLDTDNYYLHIATGNQINVAFRIFYYLFHTHPKQYLTKFIAVVIFIDSENQTLSTIPQMSISKDSLTKNGHIKLTFLYSSFPQIQVVPLLFFYKHHHAQKGVRCFDLRYTWLLLYHQGYSL